MQVSTPHLVGKAAGRDIALLLLALALARAAPPEAWLEGALIGAARASQGLGPGDWAALVWALASLVPEQVPPEWLDRWVRVRGRALADAVAVFRLSWAWLQHGFQKMPARKAGEAAAVLKLESRKLAKTRHLAHNLNLP